MCVGGAPRSQPGSETGAGGWGPRCDSAGRARKGCPAGLTGPGRPGPPGPRRGRAARGVTGRGAGRAPPAPASRAAAADQDGSGAPRPPAASGAPLSRPRRPARPQRCVCASVSRRGTPREAGTRSARPAGAGGAPIPGLRAGVAARSLSALGLSFPRGEVEGGGPLGSPRRGAAPPPLCHSPSGRGDTPRREERRGREQPSPRPAGRAEEGFQGPGASEPRDGLPGASSAPPRIPTSIPSTPPTRRGGQCHCQAGSRQRSGTDARPLIAPWAQRCRFGAWDGPEESPHSLAKGTREPVPSSVKWGPPPSWDYCGDEVSSENEVLSTVRPATLRSAPRMETSKQRSQGLPSDSASAPGTRPHWPGP